MARSDGQCGSRPTSWLTPAVMVQIILLAALLLVHYRNVLYRLVYIWRENGDWSHGFLIPFFSLYYLYLQRHRMPRTLVDRGLTARIAGAVVLTASFALYLGSVLYRFDYPQGLALVTSVMGIVLMVCGWPVARWGWFAVAFLVFALPLPDRLYFQMTLPLREVAAKVSAGVLSLVPQMQAEAQGTVVEYIYAKTAPARIGTLDIEQACGGMRLMVTMTALGVAMAFVSERALWHRMVMILSCIPIAIFCNIVRVTTTGLFVVFGLEHLASGIWHMMLGLGMLFIAFSLYSGISYVLNHLFVEGEADDAPRGG